jgi:hypothetical protein
MNEKVGSKVFVKCDFTDNPFFKIFENLNEFY